MEKVSFMGLSGSGKSCYIYAMSHAMMEGVQFPDGSVLNVTCSTMAQMARLHNEYMKMVQGSWPPGTSETTDYSYSSRLRLRKIMDFQLRDYRGGLLDTFDEDDIDEHKKLFANFGESCTLLFFIGADTVLKAMDGDFMEDYKIGNLGVLYGEYLENVQNVETPVLIIISKADMLPSDRVDAAKEYVKSKLRGIFAAGTGLTVALTTITLGRNLSSDDGELQGQLIIRPTAGNIHIPILFSLYCVIAKRISDATTRLEAAQAGVASGQIALTMERSRSAIAKFFSSKENSIISNIANADKEVKIQEAALSNCVDSMSKIKGLLLAGTELYINGIRQ